MLSRTNEPTITYGQMNLLFIIRNLWRQFATWTRSYLISRFSGLHIADEVFNRLYTYHRYTLEEIFTLLTGEYSKNIDIYDRLLHHDDIIGDYFTECPNDG